MTALTKCKDCGHEISKTAEACPNCGARFKLRWYEVGPFVTKLFFVTLFLIVLVVLLGVFE
jgi:hypothetical protein